MNRAGLKYAADVLSEGILPEKPRLGDYLESFVIIPAMALVYVAIVLVAWPFVALWVVIRKAIR